MTFLCIAHRGAMGYEPENTILSIKKAIELGASWAEIDIHYIDNTLIVTHDHIINIEGNNLNLYNCNYDKIRQIDVGKGQNIPTLEQVLDISVGSLSLNIELKGSNTAAATAEVLGKYISENKYSHEDFLISSFLSDELIRFNNLMPEIPVGILNKEDVGEALKLSIKLKAYSINIPISLATESAIDLIHKQGIKVFVYTANTYDEIRKLKKYGADGVFTNYIDICQKCMKEGSWL